MSMPIESPTRPRNSWRTVIWTAAACLLALPWIAMQFTHEVNWTLSDFVVFGVMLGIGCGLYEWAAWRKGHHSYRLASALALGGGFMMVWANLAVGIIGSENNPVNRIFFALPALGLVGAVLVRFSAAGMMRVMQCMALAQSMIFIVALTGVLGSESFLPVFTVLYTGLWLLAAGLYRRAAKAEDRTA